MTVPDIEALWYVEPREDVGRWLQSRGWTVSAVGSEELMQRYDRIPPEGDDDLAPQSLFVDAVKI